MKAAILALLDPHRWAMVSAPVTRSRVAAPDDHTLHPNRAMATKTPRLGRPTRWALALAALGIAGVLATARGLEPDPRGYGTHVRLGLPPCQFCAVTGYRCPSCGMTTAFACVVRGRLGAAWRANPAGSLLAPLCAVLVPWLLAVAIGGRPWGFRTLDGPLTVLVVAAVAVSLVAWTVRLLLGGR
jgi:hypothetical protein